MPKSATNSNTLSLNSLTTSQKVVLMIQDAEKHMNCCPTTPELPYTQCSSSSTNPIQNLNILSATHAKTSPEVISSFEDGNTPLKAVQWLGNVCGCTTSPSKPVSECDLI